MGFTMAVAVGIRAKYYVGWTMAEAAISASGQVFNGYDKRTGEPRFDRFYAIDPLGVECSVFATVETECWNHNANMWLKRYVYFRINRVIPKDIAIYVTYMVSAFWHGFYPMYFLVFFLYAVIAENYKDIYKLCVKYPILRSLPCLTLF